MMELWQIILIVIASVLFIFMILYLIFLHKLFNILFKRLKKEVLLTDIDLEKTRYKPFMDMVTRNMNVFSLIPYYKVSIISKDGLKLYGKYYKNNNSDKLAIFFHGYHADPLNNVNTPGLKLLNDGYNLLVVYQRGHGLSEGKYITFGVKEKEDALEWIDFVNKEYKPKEILLWGVSMGCATIEMTSDRLPSNVIAMVLDCGFSGAYEEVSYSIQRKIKIKPRIGMFFISIIAKIHGFKLEKNMSLKSLSKTRVPAFFIHGLKDEMVPLNMGQMNYNACSSKKEMVLVDTAHATSIYVLYQDIIKKLDKFLEENRGCEN